RYIAVVGIGASLKDPSELNLGDLCYSEIIDDITLGKDTIDRDLISEVGITEHPDEHAIPEEIREAVVISNGKLTLKGILNTRMVPELQRAFSNSIDKQRIAELAD